MQRYDANAEHWKAKFIDGLPPLFAGKVRQTLLERNNGYKIPYEELT